MRKTKMQKGITLIALIITIIILLILAVVTIGSIKDSDIITYAQNAATDYNDKKDEEEGILSDYESTIKQHLPGENVNSEIGKAAVGTKVTKNSTIDGKEYSSTNPIIPAGYAPINITGENNESKWDDKEGPQVNKGLVITDNTTRDDNGNTIGNEFVWVPVPDITEMVMCQVCGVNKKLDKETLQCEVHGEDTKLAGKLYATTIGENTFNASLTGQRYKEGIGLREPDVITELYNPETGENEDVSTSYIDTRYLVEKAGMPSGSTADDFKIQLQKEFNEMVASVAKYGGFYVGRYETSINGMKPQSKSGVVSATAAKDSADTWYGLYKLNKEYITSSVKSSMIWGSQYDAMMRWMENDVTNFDTNERNRDSERKTGSVPTDVIRNVYDLGGNSYEWTLEGNGSRGRVDRGGIYSYGRSPSDRSSNRPISTDSDYGSRLILYIV